MIHSRKLQFHRSFFILTGILLVSCSYLKTPTKRPERSPSQTQTLSTNELRALYSEISDEAFRQKLNRANEPLKFFRSFTRVYYRYFSSIKNDFRGSLQKASTFNGWCAGDAHSENFGSLVGETGTATFTLIDLDDSAPCSLLADLLRFLISSKETLQGGLNQQHVLTRLLDAYLDGAQGKVKLSSPTKWFLKQSESKSGFDPELKVFDGKTELTSRVSPEELQELRAVLSSVYGSISDLEATRYSKVSGGSAGMPRFRARFKLQEQWVTIELKTLQTPAVFFERPDASPPPWAPITGNPTRRILEALRWSSGSNHSRLFTVQTIFGKNLVFSPRYRGVRSIEIDRDSENSPKSALQILRDEAATLGYLHSLSATDFKHYLEVIQGTKTEDLDEPITLLWKAITKTWNESRLDP